MVVFKSFCYDPIAPFFLFAIKISQRDAVCCPWGELCVGVCLWDEFVGLNGTTNLKAGKLGRLFVIYSRELELMARGLVI